MLKCITPWTHYAVVGLWTQPVTESLNLSFHIKTWEWHQVVLWPSTITWLANLWITLVALPETVSDAATAPVIFVELRSPVTTYRILLCAEDSSQRFLLRLQEKEISGL